MADSARPAPHHCPALHHTPGYAPHLVAAHAMQGAEPLLHQYDLRLRGLWGQLFVYSHALTTPEVVAVWLDERAEALVDDFGADSVLMQGLGTAVACGLVACCTGRLTESTEQVRCRPLPRLDEPAREALRAAGLAVDGAGVAVRRFATITTTAGGGCRACTLRGECPQSADS